METEVNGNCANSKKSSVAASSSVEDLSEYTDADESISAPTEILAEVIIIISSSSGLITLTNDLIDVFTFNINGSKLFSFSPLNDRTTTFLFSSWLVQKLVETITDLKVKFCHNLSLMVIILTRFLDTFREFLFLLIV